jgi:hypothetical protein
LVGGNKTSCVPVLVPSVVGGGIGTLVVVAVVAAVWPQVRRFGSLVDAKVAQPQGADGST